MRAHLHTCTLCEAMCGVVVSVEGERVVAVRGDKDDPMSRGYLCAKGPALADIHHDPDRLTHPMVRSGDEWREVGWDEAFDLVAARLRTVRADHGDDAVAIYQGNPTVHSMGLVVFGQLLFRAIRTCHRYSSTSVDQLPQMLAAYLMFGHQLLIPVPDIDRTDLFICLGANPAASNGSLMSAPNVRSRLNAIRNRGGRVVLIDPRRTETAALADEHIFIRPGTDALLLLSMLQVIVAEDLVGTTRRVVGLDEVAAAAARYTPEATTAATGVRPDVVRVLARTLAATPRAVVYGRVGLSTQEFGGLCQWLVVVLNAVTGHLDEPGGSMFPTPAVDLMQTRGALAGTFAGFRSRVRGLPEFGGELPVATLAEEIDTPGPGQIRALVTSAGNPVLSTPNGRRLDAALSSLEFMVSIDPYLNETTRHADVILPPTTSLERSHYDVVFSALAVRNGARYVTGVFTRGPDQRHDWEICRELLVRLAVPTRLRRPVRALIRRVRPEGVIGLALWAGPYGIGRGGMSLRRLQREAHGVDLGPLVPNLAKRLRTKDHMVQLAPAEFLGDLSRLAERLEELTAPGRGDDQLLLIGRRHLRSNNSWMHNSTRLIDGVERCTLQLHPDDATERGLAHGDRATISSSAGSIDLPVEITDTVMRGVVSVPHGFGHDRPGIRLRVAAAHAGASANDITDDQVVDRLAGTAVLSGVAVQVKPATT